MADDTADRGMNDGSSPPDTQMTLIRDGELTAVGHRRDAYEAARSRSPLSTKVLPPVAKALPLPLPNVAHKNGMSVCKVLRAGTRHVPHAACASTPTSSALLNHLTTVGISRSIFTRTACPGAFTPKIPTGGRRVTMSVCRSLQQQRLCFHHQMWLNRLPRSRSPQGCGPCQETRGGQVCHGVRCSTSLVTQRLTPQRHALWLMLS